MEKTEFAKDFGQFFQKVKNEGVEATIKDVALLYAIYRKDLRSERIKNSNGNSRNRFAKDCYGISDIKETEDYTKELATDRQKQYLMDLAFKKGLSLTQEELDSMTRDQASKAIDTLVEGGGPSSSIFQQRK